MSADATLTCRDCGQAFTFTSGEQDFYAARGFSEPGRCADCRAANKAQRNGGAARGGGSGSSQGGSREMFDVTCSKCGQAAQVPFQPSGDKPVYCSTCFEKQREANRSGGARGRY
jgi:CxxC-x17-CxxC domain-containing protein